MPAERPKPGSAEALALGCICPREPNNGGAGHVDRDGGQWWTYDTDCQLHFPRTDAPAPAPVTTQQRRRRAA